MSREVVQGDFGRSRGDIVVSSGYMKDRFVCKRTKATVADKVMFSVYSRDSEACLRRESGSEGMVEIEIDHHMTRLCCSPSCAGLAKARRTRESWGPCRLASQARQ